MLTIHLKSMAYLELHTLKKAESTESRGWKQTKANYNITTCVHRWEYRCNVTNIAIVYLEKLQSKTVAVGRRMQLIKLKRY